VKRLRKVAKVGEAVTVNSLPSKKRGKPPCKARYTPAAIDWWHEIMRHSDSHKCCYWCRTGVAHREEASYETKQGVGHECYIGWGMLKEKPTANVRFCQIILRSNKISWLIYMQLWRWKTSLQVWWSTGITLLLRLFSGQGKKRSQMGRDCCSCSWWQTTPYLHACYPWFTKALQPNAILKVFHSLLTGI